MHCYIDESGNTGNELFDLNQPALYYGLITAKANLDVVALPLLEATRAKLNVARLHANELGVGRLSEVAESLGKFGRERDIRFSVYRVVKRDHAVITFFDQVFDAGLNKAVSWHHYWTPLRYPLLFKVAHLFDEDVARRAWAARQETNPARSAEALRAICATLRERIHRLPDARSREIVDGALLWAAANPFEIDYGAGNKDSALQISPNLIGFQQVLQAISDQARKQRRPVRQIVVDRQSQFNRAQGELADVYRRIRSVGLGGGPGMPKMDMSHMPEIPPEFRPGDESAGLELVDTALWATKRHLEGKKISCELNAMLASFTRRGGFSEVSLAAMRDRWRFLYDLPEPEGPLPDELKTKFAEWEEERQKAVARS